MTLARRPSAIDDHARDMLLRRRGAAIVDPDSGAIFARERFARERDVATVAANFHGMGYAPTDLMLVAMRRLSLAALGDLHDDLIPRMRRIKGDHVMHRPMYPNFPDSVMEADLAELYLNAVAHYVTNGAWRPSEVALRRLPLRAVPVDPRPLRLALADEVVPLIQQVISQNNSPSADDRADISWFIHHWPDAEEHLPPAGAVPQRETRAVVAVELARSKRPDALVATYVQTATDVLRVAALASDGDVSLAEPTQFRLSRGYRRLILRLLEAVASERSIAEDVRRHPETWKRLAHQLHVGEGSRKWPRAYAQLHALRAGERIVTLTGRVEDLLVEGEAASAAHVLATRPGSLARRLDHLLRAARHDGERAAVVLEFSKVAEQVPTPILLQLREHFSTEARGGSAGSPRVFFPKGNVGRAQVIEDERPILDPLVAGLVRDSATHALMIRFSKLPRLGRVWLDPTLEGVPVPHGGRSTSTGGRALARGTRLPIDPDAEVLRAFVWWTNGSHSRVDVDLSMAIFDDEFRHLEDVAYYRLKSAVATHSGDIVDAPDGATEFIDLRLADFVKTLTRTARYAAITINSYTGQKFSTVECFAGWMSRSGKSGEIFEPATVAERADVSAPARMAVPVIFDLHDRAAIWTDLAVKSSAMRSSYSGPLGINRGGNNVGSNRASLAQTIRAIVHAERASLMDLLALHVEARGQRVDDRDQADLVFLASELAFEGERVASEYMA